ncbi:MAG: hypothetical protein ACM3VT_20285 [Solirubrobacterales bacterium]
MHIINRILGKHQEIGGELGYFGLGEWWLLTFSTTQRRHMEAAFQGPEIPAGTRPLTRDRGLLPVQTAAGLLILLADKLANRSEDRALACSVLDKAEERAAAGHDLLSLHFTYHQIIRMHLRWKDRFRDALDLAFAASYKQMRISPEVVGLFRERYPDTPLPVHLGYLHAASTLEQQRNFSRTLEICRQAQAEGWSGDWACRIQRMARQVSEVRFISRSGMGPV